MKYHYSTYEYLVIFVYFFIEQFEIHSEGEFLQENE